MYYVFFQQNLSTHTVEPLAFEEKNDNFLKMWANSLHLYLLHTWSK
jgi:hypothetical protein